MAIIVKQERRDDGRTVVTVSGERYTHPQVVTERGADLHPAYAAMLDLAANHEANRYTARIRSASERK